MRIVITGGHGFVGTALWRELAARGTFGGPDSEAIDEIVLLDRASRPTAPVAVPVTTLEGELADTLGPAFERPVDVLFHLASAVSAECEADLDLGLAANLDGTRAVLQACRGQREAGGPPVRLVFSSSVAVYGADAALPMPEPVTEATLPLPQSSYGAQKLACEALIADYTRRGLLDGRVARLMTVAVRPGAPNKAASVCLRDHPRAADRRRHGVPGAPRPAPGHRLAAHDGCRADLALAGQPGPWLR